MKNRISEIVKSCVADDIKDKCKVEDTKKGFSVMLYTNTLLGVITDEKDKYILYFRWNDDLVSQFPEDLDLKIKYTVNPKNNTKIPVYYISSNKNENSLFETLEKLKPAIITQQEWIFENHPAETPFGCCGSYYECSICKSCFMYKKDRPFYKGCAYKNNLENGKIFYGPFRNDSIRYFNTWNEKDLVQIPSSYENSKISFTNIAPDELLSPLMKTLGIETISDDVDNQTTLLVYDDKNQSGDVYNKATLLGIKKISYVNFVCEIIWKNRIIDKHIIDEIVNKYFSLVKIKFEIKEEDEKQKNIIINAYRSLFIKEISNDEIIKLYNKIEKK